jgi:hypothetical protein
MEKQFVIIGLTILFICIGLSGCLSSYDYIILDDSFYQNAPRDSFTFNTVKLRNNILSLNISYGGGCEEHEFTLVGTSFMESNPVQVNVLLSHNANNDPCDMWITQELAFNLLPLKRAWQQSYHQKSGKIVINLQDWEIPIFYEF